MLPAGEKPPILPKDVPKHDRVETEMFMRVPTLVTSRVDHDLGERELDIVRRHFDFFDSDGSETIDVAEVHSALERLGISELPFTERELLDSMDKDSDGSLTWNEFLDIVKEVRRVENLKEERMFERQLLSKEKLLEMLEKKENLDESSIADSDGDTNEEKEHQKQLELEEQRMNQRRLAAIEKAAPAAARRRLALSIIPLYFLTYVDGGFMPVLADEFRRDLQLTEEQLGILPLAYMGGYAFFTYLIGIVAGKKRTFSWLIVFLLGQAVSNALTGAASKYWHLVVLRFITGCCNCIFGIFMIPLLYALEPHKPLIWAGIANAMVPLGMGAGYMLTGIILDAGLDWAYEWYVLGVLILINTAVIAVQRPAFKALSIAKRFQSTKQPSYKEKLRRVYCSIFNVLVLVIAGIFYMGLSTLQYWIVIFYIDKVKVSQSEAALVSGSILIVTAFLGAIIGALIVARLQGKRGIHGTMLFLVVASLVNIAAFLTYALDTSRLGIYIATGVAIASIAAHAAPLNDIPLKSLPAAYHDFGISRVSLIQGVFAAAGPAIAGVLIEKYGLPEAFFFLAMTFILAFVLCIVAYALYPTPTEMRKKQSDIVDFWTVIFKELGRNGQGYIAYDKPSHLSYSRFFKYVERYTPHVHLSSSSAQDDVKVAE